MALQSFHPHGCGRNFWDAWEWPKTLYNQNFGLDLNDGDLVLPFRMPSQRSMQKGGASGVVNDPNKFEVKLDCSHFKPEEIEVKTVDNNIVIHGKHEEKMDKHGLISREFTRKYTLPEECEPNRVVSSLSPNGVLTIEAPKKQLEPPKNNERVVPINVIHELSNTTQNQIEN